MSLDKAIKYGKEKRKPYTGSKAVFCSCRNHGSCPWCRENRQHKFRDKNVTMLTGDEALELIEEVETVIEGIQNGSIEGEYFEF